MKKHLSILLTAIAVLFMFGLGACSKDKTTKEKLTSRWDVVKLDYKYYQNNILTNEGTVDPAAGDYMEFRRDNTLVASNNGVTKTGTYFLLSDTRVRIELDGEKDEMDIQTLNDESCVLYTKRIDGLNSEELWLHLSK